MSHFGPQDYLVTTFLVFGGREFSVKVRHDGFSYWFDPFARNAALKSDPHLMAKAALFGGKEHQFLVQLEDEWTVKAPVPEAGLRFIREEISPRFWADDPMPDKILDAILEPIFWSDVNPQLSVPVETPKG